MGNPAVSRPLTSQAGQAISSADPAQPLVAYSPAKRLTATASISFLVMTLARSRASHAISGKLRTSPLDSVSTTVKRSGGTGPSSSVAVTTPSMKDTGVTLKPGLSKSPTPPSAVRYPTTPKHRSPGNSRRLSNPMLRYFSSRSAASFLPLESTFSVVLTGFLNGKYLRRISTPRFSRSLYLGSRCRGRVHHA